MHDVVLADPAWPYKDKSRHRGGAERYYRTMTIADICALPVPKIAAKNSALFLWATWPNMPQAFQVMEAWGFRYVTAAFVWVKTTKDGSKPAMGMGHYTRANSEPVLLGIRGRMPVSDHGIGQIVQSPRLEHSRKPDEFHDLIERLYPGRRYAELFARRLRVGWDSFGNEIDGNDLRWSLADYAYKAANDNKQENKGAA